MKIIIKNHYGEEKTFDARTIKLEDLMYMKAEGWSPTGKNTYATIEYHCENESEHALVNKLPVKDVNFKHFGVGYTMSLYPALLQTDTGKAIQNRLNDSCFQDIADQILGDIKTMFG